LCCRWNGSARGYRHGFLEAGLIGERLYLEAGARGLGVCAMGAFCDDEAAALVGVDPQHEWTVRFAALGAPASGQPCPRQGCHPGLWRFPR